MTISWIVYALVAGTLLASGAWLAEGVLLASRRAVRGVWVAAMLLTAGLVLAVPYRSGRMERAPAVELIAAGSGAAATAPEAGMLASLARVRAGIDAVVQGTLIGLEGRLPSGAVPILALLWVGAAALVAAVWCTTHLRMRRARRRWPMAELDGHRVRIAPAAGPAVVGIVRPEIVVPRWLLQLAAAERAAVVAHEAEHLRGRDPLLLTIGWAVVALLPWHPAAWWMLGRLRLAVEMDCDARVLRRGVDRRAYGSLLVDLAGRPSGLAASATALADEPTHLERRLLAMTHRKPMNPVRGAVLGALALLLVLAACEAKVPTASEIRRMDAAAAESQLRQSGLPDDPDASYFVDGKPSTREAAHALSADEITQIQVRRRLTRDDSSTKSRNEIHIVTKDGDQLAIAPEGGIGAEKRILFRGVDGEEPLVIVDGKRVAAGAVASLDPSTFVTVDVFKGEGAVARFGPEAAHGVVQIRTRKK